MTHRRLIAFAALAALPVIATGPAFAHITLLTQTAAVGSGYMAVFRVPHGCDGATTNAVRIQIPAGVYGVKPMPKAGWQIQISNGTYATPFTNKGTQMTQGVTEVDFTSGSLPDAYYDEFTLSVTLADSLAPGTTLYFPVVQECEGGNADRWIQIPAAGKTAGDYPNPAPGLHLTAAVASAQ